MSENTKTKDNGFKTVKGKVEFDSRNGIFKINDQVIPIRTFNADAWANILTGLGVRNRDKRLSALAQYNGPMVERDAEEIYASDGLARRIITLLPFDAIREWVKFEEKELQPKINDEVDRLKARKRIIKAWDYARLYGGSGIFVNTGEPIEKLKDPLEMNTIREIKSLVVFSRHELQVDTTDLETDISSVNFDMPKTYNFMPRGRAGGGFRIHESRIIRFDGVELPTLLRVSNQYWGDSVYTGILEALRDFGISCGSIAHIVQEFRMLVYSVQNLAQDVVAGNKEKIQERMELMNISRSVMGAFVLDKDGEGMDSMSANVTNLEKLMDVLSKRLQSVTDIPHTILFNESPSGLSATGKSEERIWYDYVSSQQEQYLAEKIDRLLTMIFAAKSGPFKGREPENWGYDFVPLWQMSDKEQAETNKMNAETDQIYVNMGTLEPSEVREDRFPDLEQLTMKSEEPPQKEEPLKEEPGVNDPNAD